METGAALRRAVGKRVYDFRSSLGYRQAKFAEAIDISVNFLSEIENGRKGMSQDTLYKLCTSFHVTADYFILGTPLKEEENDTRTIVEIAQKMPDHELNILLNYLISLKEMRELEKKHTYTSVHQ